MKRFSIDGCASKLREVEEKLDLFQESTGESFKVVTRLHLSDVHIQWESRVQSRINAFCAHIALISFTGDYVFKTTGNPEFVGFLREVSVCFRTERGVVFTVFEIVLGSIRLVELANDKTDQNFASAYISEEEI